MKRTVSILEMMLVTAIIAVASYHGAYIYWHWGLSRAAWEAAARDCGYTLAEYVREAVDERVEADSGSRKPKKGKAVKTAMSVKTDAVKTGTARTGMCEHRVPATSFCARCDS